MLAKALSIRLIAVLIAGALATAPFSCCCAAMQSRAVEALVHSVPATMDGMHHGRVLGQMPADHLCPHRLTADLDAGKMPVQPLVAPFAKPVVDGGAAVLDLVSEQPTMRPVPHIRPPPNRQTTLVSQHILLLI